MIRKLVFALSLLGACFTGLVHALGLGEATVKSSLNQPLTAEIELVSVGGLGVDEILPGLATREEFLRAKVDRVYFLSDLRFEMVENEKGNLAVVLTTTKPVREPFLNFLVEVIWPSGRLLREYALLIDPPLYSEEQATPVQAPTVTQLPAIDSDNQKSGGDQLSIASSSKASVAAINTSGQGGGSYGATTASDTLWDIAVEARPDRSVTPQQVMLSIQDLNPKAFINQNINKLKAGQVLRLPTIAQIKERSSSQAIIEVIAQNEALSPKRTRSVASAAKAAPVAKPSSNTTTTNNADELKLVVASAPANASNTANSGSSAQAGNGRADSNEEMMLALEKLDKANLENTELNGRVTDLEEQLQTLERILALKNDQLANIQGQMRANELAALGEGDENSTEQVNAEQNALEEPVVEQDAVASTEVVADKTQVEEAQKAPVDVAKEVVVPKKPVPVQAPEPVKAENIVGMILSSPLYIGLLAVGVVILLAVLLWVSRHNARKEEAYYAQNTDEDDETLENVEAFAEDGSEIDDFVESSDELAEDEQEGGEHDFEHADEESGADLEPSDDESESEDVIAEADVYIAYGRLDQASNILENAISADPVRTDYRLKLLEVYKDSNDTEAFNRQFSELEAIQDADAIEEATKIRAALLENELVSLEDKEQALAESRQREEALESKQEQAALEAEEEALELENVDNTDQSFNFDSVEDAGDEDLEVDFSSDELELDLDVDLDLAQEDELLAAEVDDLELESNDLELGAADLVLEETNLELEADELEADISLLEQVEADEAPELEPKIEPQESGADILDIDLDDVDLSGELDQENEIELSSELSAELDMATADADELSSLTEESAVTEVVSDDTSGEPISDDILEEAVDAFTGADELADNLGESDDFDFLDGTDEASTKLDLARAYIDMGDVEGAKDILAEVAKEGSQEQQAEANDLLSSLDA